MGDLQKTINVANEQFEMTAEMYRKLAQRGCNATDLRKYVKLVLTGPDVLDKEGNPEALSTRMSNTIDEIIHCVASPLTHVDAADGTWWAAYNGMTQYLSYNRGNNANNRVRELWYGKGAEMNSLALDKALELSGVKSVAAAA
jgi:hypothetical protein